MKVLHIITRLEKGGPTEELKFVVKNLKEFDHKIVAGYSKNEIDISDIRNIIIRSKFLKREPSLKDILTILEIFYIIKREKPDIVHTRTSKAGFVGRIAARLAGVKKIFYSPHGHIFYGYFGPIRTKIFIILERFASKFCDAIVVRTKDEEIWFRRIGCNTNFFYVTRGVFKDLDLEEWEKSKKEVKEPKKEYVVGVVARLEPVKGVEYFISSIPKILERFPNTRFVVVGDGSQRKKLEDISRGLPVDFLGWRDDVLQVMKDFDILVVPSLNEAWGAVICEAGVVGVPVIATEVGGIPHFAGDSVFKVKPKSLEDIANAVIKILSDEDLRKELTNKIKNLPKIYTSERTLKEYRMLYNF